MNELQIFENPEFGQIRGVEIDGKPWVVGKDAALPLGYANPSKAIIDHVDDEDKRFEMLRVSDSQNGNLVKTALINESGLYSLILSSKLPGAKKFKRWVTSGVLPSIRKTGGYTFDGSSKELKAIFMLDSRTIQHEQRIAALEDTMVVDYGQQRTLTTQVNTVVVNALGGLDSPAYHDKHVRGRVYSECNRDIQNWFRVSSRNNVPRKRYDEAVEYIRRWRPSTNMSMTIRQTNGQMQF